MSSFLADNIRLLDVCDEWCPGSTAECVGCRDDRHSAPSPLLGRYDISVMTSATPGADRHK